MSQLHRKRQTAYNSLFVSNADYRFLSRILLIDKCVRRSSLVKNAKRYNRFGHEHYLDRGDFNNVGSASGIQRAKSVYFRQTNWIPFTELSAQDITTSPIERNRKERSVFLKKGISIYYKITNFFIFSYVLFPSLSRSTNVSLIRRYGSLKVHRRHVSRAQHLWRW